MVRLAFLLWLMVMPAASAQPVNIFAASSLSGTLDAVFESWSGGSARITYAGSATLARQILSGAPADVFVSAHPQWVDVLAERGALVPGTEIVVAGNTLVLVSAEPGPPLLAETLVEGVAGERIAVGLLEAVPAGLYAKAALQSLGLYDSLRPQLVEMDNVRAALALVTRGAAAFAIVYASDAMAADVPVRFAFPEASHPTIAYVAAAVRDAPEARAAVTYLASPDALAVLRARGFGSPP